MSPTRARSIIATKASQAKSGAMFPRDALSSLECQLQALHASRPDRDTLEDLIGHIEECRSPSVEVELPSFKCGVEVEAPSLEVEVKACSSVSVNPSPVSRPVLDVSGHNVIAVCSNCSDSSHHTLRSLRALCDAFPDCASALTKYTSENSVVPGSVHLLDTKVDNQLVAVMFTAYNTGATEIGMTRPISDAVRYGWLESALTDLVAKVKHADGIEKIGLLVDMCDTSRFEQILTKFDSGGMKFRLLGLDIHGATQHVAPSEAYRQKQTAQTSASPKTPSKSTASSSDVESAALNTKKVSAPTTSASMRLNSPKFCAPKKNETSQESPLETPRKELIRAQLKHSEEERLKAETALQAEKADRHREDEIVADELAQMEARQSALEKAHADQKDQLEKAEQKRIEAERMLAEFQANRVREEEMAVKEMEEMSKKVKLELLKVREEQPPRLIPERLIEKSTIEVPEVKTDSAVPAVAASPTKAGGWFS